MGVTTSPPDRWTRLIGFTEAAFSAPMPEHDRKGAHFRSANIQRPGLHPLATDVGGSNQPVYRDKVKRDETVEEERLPSRSSAGEVIGGFMANLDHLIAARPKTPAQIEEQYREPWASANGVTVDGLDDPIERREAPDRSGAKL